MSAGRLILLSREFVDQSSQIGFRNYRGYVGALEQNRRRWMAVVGCPTYPIDLDYLSSAAPCPHIRCFESKHLVVMFEDWGPRKYEPFIVCHALQEGGMPGGGTVPLLALVIENEVHLFMASRLLLPLRH